MSMSSLKPGMYKLYSHYINIHRRKRYSSHKISLYLASFIGLKRRQQSRKLSQGWKFMYYFNIDFPNWSLQMKICWLVILRIMAWIYLESERLATNDPLSIHQTITSVFSWIVIPIQVKRRQISSLKELEIDTSIKH